MVLKKLGSHMKNSKFQFISCIKYKLSLKMESRFQCKRSNYKNPKRKFREKMLCVVPLGKLP